MPINVTEEYPETFFWIQKPENVPLNLIMKGYGTHFKCHVVFANECMKKTRIPSIDGGDYLVWEVPV